MFRHIRPMSLLLFALLATACSEKERQHGDPAPGGGVWLKRGDQWVLGASLNDRSVVAVGGDSDERAARGARGSLAFDMCLESRSYLDAECMQAMPASAGTERCKSVTPADALACCRSAGGRIDGLSDSVMLNSPSAYVIRRCEF